MTGGTYEFRGRAAATFYVQFHPENDNASGLHVVKIHDLVLTLEG